MFLAIAGNIIPAIATANALIAGVAVLYAFRLLEENFLQCPPIYLRQKSIYSKIILAADKEIQKANPQCYVCSPKPTVNIFVNVNSMKVAELETEVLKNALNMVAPDVILDGKGVVVISSEEGETEVCIYKYKTLTNFWIAFNWLLIYCDHKVFIFNQGGVFVKNVCLVRIYVES